MAIQLNALIELSKVYCKTYYVFGYILATRYVSQIYAEIYMLNIKRIVVFVYIVVVASL